MATVETIRNVEQGESKSKTQRRIDKLVRAGHDKDRELQVQQQRIEFLVASNKQLVAGQEQLAAENRALLIDLKAADELVRQYRVELAKARNNGRKG